MRCNHGVAVSAKEKVRGKRSIAVEVRYVIVGCQQGCATWGAPGYAMDCRHAARAVHSPRLQLCPLLEGAHYRADQGGGGLVELMPMAKGKVTLGLNHGVLLRWKINDA